MCHLAFAFTPFLLLSPAQGFAIKLQHCEVCLQIFFKGTWARRVTDDICYEHMWAGPWRDSLEIWQRDIALNLKYWIPGKEWFFFFFLSKSVSQILNGTYLWSKNYLQFLWNSPLNLHPVFYLLSLSEDSEKFLGKRLCWVWGKGTV